MFEISYADLTKGKITMLEVRSQILFCHWHMVSPPGLVATYTYSHLLSILNSVEQFFWEQTGSLTSIV